VTWPRGSNPRVERRLVQAGELSRALRHRAREMKRAVEVELCRWRRSSEACDLGLAFVLNTGRFRGCGVFDREVCNLEVAVTELSLRVAVSRRPLRIDRGFTCSEVGDDSVIRLERGP